MKLQAIILFVFTIVISFYGCNEDKTETKKQITKVKSTEIIETKNISEEKIDPQTTNKELKKEQTKDKEPLNLLDTQAKVYSDVFGKLGGVEELQGIEGFIDLVKNMDATPETKKQLTEQYELYSKSLDPEKKEELKAQFNTMLLEAMKQ